MKVQRTAAARKRRNTRSVRVRSMVSGVLAAGLGLGMLAAPTAAFAAPSGSFDSLTMQKQADGYSFTNNPVDDSGNNNVVAVNDYVGFRIQGNTDGAVSEAAVTLTKPSCFIWESSVDANLTFSLDGGQTTGSVAHPDSDTVTVTWSQAANGTVLTQPFRAQAGPGCADGTTWAPTLNYTDASGTHTQTLDTITVRSVAAADLSISTTGGPGSPANRWVQGLGTVPVIHQQWKVSLSPETLSTVGYADPDGNVVFTVSFSGPLQSTYELPRGGNVTGCWQYVSPSASNNGNYGISPAPPQVLTITMSRSAACTQLFERTGGLNTLIIDAWTPLSLVEANGCSANITATVAASAWVDRFGRPIGDNPLTNNSATTTLECDEVAYGWTDAAGLIAPTQASASYDTYPRYNAGAATIPTGDWASVAGSQIGAEGQFMSLAAASYDHDQLDDFASYHFWDPSKQQLDIGRLDKSVLGWLSPNSAHTSTPMPSSSYVRECTIGFDGSNANSAADLNWVDCTTLSAEQINGLRFRVLAPLTNSGTLWSPNFPNVKQVFSQVAFLAVGDPVIPTTTTTRWTSSSFTASDVTTGTTTTLGVNSRGKSVTTTIVGNTLQVTDQADITQVQPDGVITYTIGGQAVQPAGTFLPITVPNLTFVNQLDVGITSVDLSGLDPFWNVTVEAADLGPDGVPYTSDDVRGIRLTFTPAVAVDTQTVLPDIVYTAQMGILLPPTASPYNSTVNNTVVVSADYSSGSRSAAASVLAGTPEAAFFSKQLISDPVIEVEDLPAAWRVQWVNYNNYSLGQGRFVDVFPYDGDSRGTDFDGSISLTQIERIGAAAQAGTIVELTTDTPGSIGSSPAASTNWVVVDPADSSTWPQNPTAVRITVPNIEASTQGFGAVDLRFEVDEQRRDNIYYNDASATVFNPVQDTTVNLGTRSGDPVSVIGSSIAGVAFVDKNSNGLRDDDEPLLADVPVKLFRAEHGPGAFRTTTTNSSGAYKFDNLHSSNPIMAFALTDFEYQVVFDVPGLTAMGYELTTQLIDGGISSEIDSDADTATGEVASLALGKDEHVQHLDAGVLAIGPQATITADASLQRSYNWGIDKSAINKSVLSVDPDTGAATIDYELKLSEVDYTDSNAQLAGEVAVSNPTDDKTYTINTTVVADGSGLSCTVTNGTNLTLFPTATLTLPYSCTGLPGTDLDRTVTATITVVDQDPLGTAISDLQPFTDVDYALTEINKTVNASDVATVGGAPAPATSFGPYTWGDDANGEYTEQYSLDIVVPAGECLVVDNVATITETGQRAADSLTPCLPLDVTVGKNVTTALDRTYGWDIDKELTNPAVQLDADGKATLDYEVTVTELAKQDARWSMTGNVTVKNPNKYKSVDVTLSDVTNIGGGAVCAFVGGSQVTLAAQQTRDLAYSCSFTSEPSYNGENTATIEWQSDLPGVDRSLTQAKNATAIVPIAEQDWTLHEFQRTVTVEDFVAFDDEDQPKATLGSYTWSAEGTVHTESYSVPIEVPLGSCLMVDNTATIIELGLQAILGHTFCKEVPLSVADPLSASLVRSYDWKIKKQLTNRDEIAADSTPESVRANYSVTVTEGKSRDSAHQLTGRIEITNPNDYRAFIVDIAQSISIDGLTCVISNASNVTVPAGRTVTLPYACSGDPGSALSGVHAVTVSGADIDPISHNEQVDYRVTEVNRTVTITDDKYDFTSPWTIRWSAVGTEHVREYGLTVTTKADSCQTFTNNAAIKQTGQVSSASFRICANVAASGGGNGDGSGGGSASGLELTGGASKLMPLMVGALLLLAGFGVLAGFSRRKRS